MEEEEFKKLCNKLISKNEESLRIARENVRVSSKKNTLPAIILSVSFIVFIISAILVEDTHNNFGYLLALLSVLAFAITIKKFLHMKEEKSQPYNELYQDKIIKPLMQLFYNEPYVYMPDVGFPKIDFEKIELSNFNTYYSSNLILGKINKNTEFKAANVVAINTTYTTSTNDTVQSIDKEIFNGIVIELESPKVFNEFLYLKPKTKNSILLKPLSDFLKNFNLKQYKINEENIKDFDIYTSSEDFAQTIPLYNITQKFLACKKALSQNNICQLVIRKNHIYLMFPNAKIPGTNIILYDNNESMCQELWREFEKFNYLFKLSNEILDILLVIE